MTDMLEYISTWMVLKWVVLVLVAGFIGQFGRMLAENDYREGTPSPRQTRRSDGRSTKSDRRWVH